MPRKSTPQDILPGLELPTDPPRINVEPARKQRIPDFEFPVFLKSAELEETDLKNRLPLELFLRHDGHEVVIRGEKYILRIPDYKESPRDTLKLDISSWRGISLGAIHFYGSLVFPYIQFEIPGTNTHSAGSGFPNFLHKVALQRPLTNQEILDNPERYKAYRPGMMTSGFNTREEILVRAKAIRSKYFPGFKIKLSEY